MKRSNNVQLLVIGCGVAGGLMCLRALSSVFMYPLAVWLLAMFLFCPVEVCLQMLLFLITGANIIKFTPGQISLFTVCFAMYVIRMLLQKKRLQREFAACTLIFVTAAFVSSGFDGLITIATMGFGFAMVNDACTQDKYSWLASLYCFCAGICLASLLGLFAEEMPQLSQFIKRDVLKMGDRQYALRFAGLHGNPNYYTLDISVALACLGADMCRRKPTLIGIAMFAALTVFGLMSVSKSFLLVWFLVVGMIAVYAVHKGRRPAVLMAAGMIGIGLIVYLFAWESVEMYLIRLAEGGDGGLSGFTTGRTGIWREYLREIFGSVRAFFIGNGLNAIIPGGRAAHNTYVESMYMLGAVGTAAYIIAIRSAVRLPSPGRLNIMYLPIAVLLIRFLAAGIFTYDNTWFYYALICIGWQNGRKRG